MQDTSTTPGAGFPNPPPAGKQRWVKAAAVLTLAIGLVVLCGWAFGIDALKRLLPGLVTMKANTAAAFVLSGICLYLQTLYPASPVFLLARRIAATLVLLIGLATLCEYQFGWDAGIDQLLFGEPPGEILTSHPGRMSTITATNFALIGGVLLLIEARLWVLAQAAALAVAMFALMPLAGYIFGNLALTHIGDTTAIAAHTVTAFLILAAGALAETRNHGPMAWLRRESLAIGLAASLIMLVFTFGAAAYNFVQKDKASQWVEYTYRTLQSMESYSDSMHDFLYHNRGFLITGDGRQLIEGNMRREAMATEFARMHQLVSDKPVQRERLKALDELARQRMEQADLAVRVWREKGPKAAAAMISSGHGEALTGKFDAKLDELRETERSLLKERQRIAEVIRASSLFNLGVLLVASMLLLLWVFRASRREIIERGQSEEKLRVASLYVRSLIEASLDPLVTISPQGKIADANKAAEEATGISRSELIGTDFSSYFTEPEKAQAGYRQVFDQGFVRDYPLTIRHRSGRLIDVLYNATVYRDEAGSVRGVFAAARDITERKRAEERLRISEERLALAVNTGNIGIWDWDVENNILLWDDSMYRLYSIRREDFGGAYEAWVSTLHPEDKTYIEGEIQAALCGEREYAPEFRVIWPDGSVHYIKAASHTLFDAMGKPLRMVGINYDMTERKLAEQELREKEERLALATIHNGVGVWDWNLITQEMIWDDSMFSLYHIHREDFIGTEEAWRAALHPDDLHRGDQEVNDAIAGIRPFNTEFRVVWPEGEIRHIKAVAKVFRSEQGTPLRMLGINMDITELRRVENIQAARLRLTDYAASHTLKELLVATLDEVCALTGSSIGFYHFLEADQKTLSLQAWSTRTTREFCKAEGEGSHYDIDQAGVWVDCVRERRPVIHNDYEVLPHKRGMPPGHAHVERELVVPIFRNELIVAILGVGNKATPYRDNDLDSVTRLADLAWDIAVARRADEEVHRLNAELERRVEERTASLEAANKDMESFSYSISHDLRAPLRAINGFSRILQEEYAGKLDEEGKRLLGVVGGNARKMGELIDDILAFSRAGRNEIERSTIDMKSMVAGVWEELGPDMAGREVRLCAGDLPPAEGDAAMIHQVIFNLLSNAVKFTQHRADACVEISGDADVHETVYHVKDNGVGFDMQYMDKLFGVFQRLHGMDEFEGTGIGLAIVKRIVIKHGGRVWAEGEVGVGATIHFALPNKGLLK